MAHELLPAPVMLRSTHPTCFLSALIVSSLPLAACDLPLDEAGSAGDDLTSVSGVEHILEFDSFVYVPAGAGDDHVRWHVQRQVKSALGALREVEIGIMDRDATHNLDSAAWRRSPLTVIDAAGNATAQVERVTFHYRDTALVDADRIPSGPLPLTLLFGDYPARRNELVPACSDDAAAEADSLWYHYSPRRSACQLLITSERSSIATAAAALDDPNTQISTLDADRRFVSFHATLTPVAAAPERYPEYDRLWGFRDQPDRTQLVAYVFFGVDRDEGDPNDYGLRELLRFQRTVRQRFPELRVTHTAPFAMLLDFWIDGQRVPNVTFDDVERWILDDAGFPAQAYDSSRRAALKQQVIERFAERWIYWQLPVTVSDGSQSRQMTVELRCFYGYEDGSDQVRQYATWRYLEAFWHADVFAYTGHSHFGHGPLEPTRYHGGNFPWRYQVMLVNSCLSFNYYDQDFLAMHPGGSANLDIVVNGLSAYWHGMGQATANFVLSLIDGQDKTWRQLLDSMKVDLPWSYGYDPMRAVNGELDNTYDGAARPLTVTPR